MAKLRPMSDDASALLDPGRRSDVGAAIELINKMQQTANALQQAGIVKPAQAKAPS